MKAENAAGTIFVGIHEVGAVSTVDVHVDEAGNDETVDTLGAGGRVGDTRDVRDPALVHHDEDVVANRTVDESPAKEAALGHRQIFPRMAGRPPVAPATFVCSPYTESFAIMAIAIASFASLAW